MEMDEKDEEMKDDNEKIDGKLSRDNNQLFGLFNLPGVIRSYEANQFNYNYH